MRLAINAQDRELALFALELADKECEAARKGLERLRQEHFGVQALQGTVGTLRRALKDTKRYVYEWSFDDRRALATAFHIYRERLGKLSATEGKLLVRRRRRTTRSPTYRTSSRGSPDRTRCSRKRSTRRRRRGGRGRRGGGERRAAFAGAEAYAEARQSSRRAARRDRWRSRSRRSPASSIAARRASTRTASATSPTWRSS
jgi:hypothetical protein